MSADTGQVIFYLNRMDTVTMVYACLLQLVTLGLINLQWGLAGKALGTKIPWQEILFVNMAGTFVESVTPAVKTGGEVTKVILLRSRGGLPAHRAAALVLLQKTVSMVSFFLLSLVGLAWYVGNYGFDGPQGNLLTAGFFFFLLLLSLFLGPLFFSRGFSRFLPLTFFNKDIRENINIFTVSLHSSFKRAFLNSRYLAGVFLLSLFIWTLFAWKAYLIAQTLGLPVGFLQVSLITYLAYMAALVPLLPGGMGSFEAAMVFFFLPLGIPAYQGFTAAIVLRVVTFWFVFLLSALYLGLHSAVSLLGHGKKLETVGAGEGME